MQTIGQLLNHKKHSIISVSPDISVFESLKVMADNEIGALLITVEGKLVGILSERDYARKVILHGKNSKETKVSEIMTEKVFTIQQSSNLEECMQIMTNSRIRHLPVFNGEELVGVVSIGDVLKAVLQSKEQLINQLEQYISGGQFTA